MFLETIIIPLINFTFVIVTLQFALFYDNVRLLGPYYVGLTILDLSLYLYSIIMEKKIAGFFFLGVINRVTYGLGLEVIRFLSILDEIFKLPMKWGVLKRKGIN